MKIKHKSTTYSDSDSEESRRVIQIQTQKNHMESYSDADTHDDPVDT